MSEQPIEYQIETIRRLGGDPVAGVDDIIPTRAELRLIARLRQHRGMMIVDADSMCLWTAGRMEQCNGRQPR